MTEPEKAMDLVAAKAALRAAEERRVQACVAEIDAVLRKHGCALAAEPVFTPDGRVAARVRVEAAEG